MELVLGSLYPDYNCCMELVQPIGTDGMEDGVCSGVVSSGIGMRFFLGIGSGSWGIDC